MGARDEKVSRWESPLIDVILWAFAIVATGVTVWYSLGPRPPGHGSDKDLHAVAYFVNTLAVLLALVWRPGRAPRRYDGWALPVALGILMLGGVIEIAQAGFADRDAQFGDWIADAVGVVLALGVFTGMRWVSDRRRREHPTP